LFDVAEEYINDLIRRNMIQQDNMLMVRYYLLSSQKMMSHKTFGLHEKMVETCQVHDMLLEIIVSKSKEANFVSLVQQQYGGGLPHGKVRRLSVHGNDDYNEDEHSSPNKRNKKEVEQHCRRARHGGIEAMNLQHLRSLTTFQSEGLGLDKLLDRLDEFKLRRVLDLENCKALQDKHMRDVYRLYLLRFLSLRNTEISDA
jgi:disease resistance protein RPM1